MSGILWIILIKIIEIVWRVLFGDMFIILKIILIIIVIVNEIRVKFKVVLILDSNCLQLLEINFKIVDLFIGLVVLLFEEVLVVERYFLISLLYLFDFLSEVRLLLNILINFGFVFFFIVNLILFDFLFLIGVLNL